MAHSADFHDEISKGLECSVCMAILDNPKVLKCHHWFCKSCIDELLDFNTDGSAVITCPMKCKPVTFVKSDQTTNDLPIPYQLTSLLDVFLSRDKQRMEAMEKHATCQREINCCDKISLYCNTCNIMLCGNCSPDHNLKKHNNIKIFSPIQFEMKSEKVMPNCKEHSTLSKYVCCKNKFICIYCKHRRHRVHQSTSIQEEADHIREFLGKHEMEIGTMDNVLKNAVRTLQSTNTYINQIRDNFKLSLKNRKLKCLNEYMSFLNQEESIMLEKYDILAKEHVEKYPQVITKDYFEITKAKHDIQIIREKEKIMKNIFSFTSGQTIPSVQVDLLEPKSIHESPFGKLRVETIGHLTCDIPVDSSFQANYALFDYSETALGLLTDLQKAVEEVLAQNKIHEISHPNSFTSLPINNQSSLTIDGIDEPKTDCNIGASNCLGGAVKKKGKSPKVKPSDSSEESAADETFENLREQLCDSVDEQFDTLLKAIQDQFLLSEGLDIDLTDGSGDSNDDVEVEETEELEAEEENIGEGTSEDIDQMCNQS